MYIYVAMITSITYKCVLNKCHYGYKVILFSYFKPFQPFRFVRNFVKMLASFNKATNWQPGYGQSFLFLLGFLPTMQKYSYTTADINVVLHTLAWVKEYIFLRIRFCTDYDPCCYVHNKYCIIAIRK